MAKRPPHNRAFVRLAPSSIHGVGVFTILPIPKGTYIFYGDNSSMVWIKKSKLKSLPREILRLYEDFCVSRGDSLGCPQNFNRLTPAWYLNHSRSPNVGIDKRYRFYALRNIKKGKELTVDYRTYSDSPEPA